MGGVVGLGTAREPAVPRVDAGGPAATLPGPVFRKFLAKLPLTDRITFVRELWAAAAWGLYSGLALSLLSIIGRRIGVSAGGLAFMLSMPFVGAFGSFFVGHQAAAGGRCPSCSRPNLAASLVLMLAAFVRWRGVLRGGGVDVVRAERPQRSRLRVDRAGQLR